MADEQPVERPKDRIRRHNGLMRKEDNSQQELLRVSYAITADREVIRQPRLIAWRAKERDGEREKPWERNHHQYDSRPPDDRAGKYEPACDEHGQLCDLDEASAQIVEDFPPGDRR